MYLCFRLRLIPYFYRQCENACKVRISTRYMQIFVKKIVVFGYFFGKKVLLAL